MTVPQWSYDFGKKREIKGTCLDDKPKSVACTWLANRNRNRADKATFNPNLGPGKQAVNAQGQILFNTWQGLAVEPKQGDWSLIRQMLLENHCDGDEEKFKWLLQWCAFRVRNPGRKMDTYSAFRGRKGLARAYLPTS